MIMTTIQAGFIVIYKLSQHFPSHLKQIQTKRTYLENKQTNLWLPKWKRQGRGKLEVMELTDAHFHT